MKRRTFLSLMSTAAASQGSSFSQDRTAQPMRILFLGGTHFVGPAIVEYGLARGHRFTLFNRGQTNPHLFPELEKIRGNRYPDRGNGLEGLRNRKWDVVIDTWQGPPHVAQKSAEMLASQADHYVYISSVAVYGSQNFREVGVDEKANLPPAPSLSDQRDESLSYPTRKQLAEQVIRKAFASRFLINRCSAIVGCTGAGDVSDTKLAYWPVRIDQGGEILAPGSPSDTNQWIDVRDLGRWVIQSIEQKRTGIFNILRTQRMDEFLYGLKAQTGTQGFLTWVPAPFLFARKVFSFVDVPLWVSHQEKEKGFYQFSNEKAVREGLQLRAMTETFSWVREGYYRFQTPEDFFNPNKSCCSIALRESSLLSEWHRGGD